MIHDMRNNNACSFVFNIHRFCHFSVETGLKQEARKEAVCLKRKTIRWCVKNSICSFRLLHLRLEIILLCRSTRNKFKILKEKRENQFAKLNGSIVLSSFSINCSAGSFFSQRWSSEFSKWSQVVRTYVH